MTRLSGKKIISKENNKQNFVNADFNKAELDGFVADRGYNVIFEKAILCPCKEESSTHQNICKNCAGTGWIFVNPTSTRMSITGIMSDGKFKSAQWIEWGMIDSGMCMITALATDKLSFMDRVTISNAYAERSEILFVKATNDETEIFAYTKYNILSIEYIGLFVSVGQKLKKLEHGVDYTFRDNVINLNIIYAGITMPTVTIRYRHRPMFHIVDVLRESISSTSNSIREGQVRFELPVKALGKRAHLVKDFENYTGTALFDNSWLPDACASDDDLQPFFRQLKYTSASQIYQNLTESQIAELDDLIHSS